MNLQFFNANFCLFFQHCGYDGMAAVDMTYFGYERMEKTGGSWPVHKDTNA